MKCSTLCFLNSSLCFSLSFFFSHPLSAQNVYFGNLHSHTGYSDGSGQPEEAFKYARDIARLDFLAITEHNHKYAEAGTTTDRRDGKLIANQSSLYNGSQPSSLRSAALNYTKGGTFVALFGQEFSSISKGNHINIFEISNVVDVANGRFDFLVKNWLPNNLDSESKPAIIQFNHPGLFDNDDLEYGADDFGSISEWIREMSNHVSLIEVLCGPAMTKENGVRSQVMEVDYLYYLHLGFHIGPTAGQDNHYLTWGTATDARTGIVSTELTKSSVLTALRNRNVYATEDKNLRIIFRVNGHLSGARVPAPEHNQPFSVECSLHDDDEPDARYSVSAFLGTIAGGPAIPVSETNFAGNTTKPLRISGIFYQGGFQYIFLKIKQLGNDSLPDYAWTAPVWFEPEGSPNMISSSIVFDRHLAVIEDPEIPKLRLKLIGQFPENIWMNQAFALGIRLVVTNPDDSSNDSPDSFQSRLSPKVSIHLAGAADISPGGLQPLRNGVAWWSVFPKFAGDHDVLVSSEFGNISFKTEGPDTTTFRIHVNQPFSDILLQIFAIIGGIATVLTTIFSFLKLAKTIKPARKKGKK